MGSSTVEFRGTKYEENTALLELWLYFLADEMDKAGDAEWLRKARDDWRLQATAGFGYGIVPKLDDYIVDAARGGLLISLCDDALERISGYGEVIGKDTLNAFRTGGDRSTFLRDLPVKNIAACGIRFIELLEDGLEEEEALGP